MAASFSRRQVIVDRKLQLGLTLKILGVLAAYLLLFGLLTTFGPFLLLLLGKGSAEADVLVATERWSDLAKTVAIPTVLTFTCLSLHCILLSHRIAGPIYRIKKALGLIESGDLTADFHLRKDDYLKDLAESLESTVGRLRCDLSELKDHAQELTYGLSGAGGGTPDETAAQIETARESAQSLLRILEAYRFSAEADEDLIVPMGNGPAAEPPAEKASEDVATHSQ